MKLLSAHLRPMVNLMTVSYPATVNDLNDFLVQHVALAFFLDRRETNIESTRSLTQVGTSTPRARLVAETPITAVEKNKNLRALSEASWQTGVTTDMAQTIGSSQKDQHTETLSGSNASTMRISLRDISEPENEQNKQKLPYRTDNHIVNGLRCLSRMQLYDVLAHIERERKTRCDELTETREVIEQ